MALPAVAGTIRIGQCCPEKWFFEITEEKVVSTHDWEEKCQMRPITYYVVKPACEVNPDEHLRDVFHYIANKELNMYA